LRRCDRQVAFGELLIRFKEAFLVALFNAGDKLAIKEASECGDCACGTDRRVDALKAGAVVRCREAES
jgi:hypothetical protein